jgi:spore coat protein U-like protein
MAKRLAIMALLLLAAGAALANGDESGGGAGGVTCTASSVTIDFGVYDVLSEAPLDGAGSFTVTCRNERASDVTVVYIAKLAAAPARQLAPPAGADRLTYNVYVDAARTLPWGDGTAGSFPIVGVVGVPGRSSVIDRPRNFYGRIAPGGQDVSAVSPGPPPTIYSQLLTITVSCQPSPPC